MILQLYEDARIYLFGNPKHLHHQVESSEEAWLSKWTHHLPHLEHVAVRHTTSEFLKHREGIHYEGSSRVYAREGDGWFVEYDEGWSDSWISLTDPFGDENWHLPGSGIRPERVPRHLFYGVVQQLQRQRKVNECRCQRDWCWVCSYSAIPSLV